MNKVMAWTRHEIHDYGLGVLYTAWVVLLAIYLSMTLA